MQETPFDSQQMKFICANGNLVNQELCIGIALLSCQQKGLNYQWVFKKARKPHTREEKLYKEIITKCQNAHECSNMALYGTLKPSITMHEYNFQKKVLKPPILAIDNSFYAGLGSFENIARTRKKEIMNKFLNEVSAEDFEVSK